MKVYLKVILIGTSLLWVKQISSQTVKTAVTKDTTVQYLSKFVKSADANDKVLLENKLYILLKSDKEKDWLTARNFFYQIKKVAVSDSISKADKIRFPLGLLVRGDETKPIYDENDAVKKEQLYKTWYKKFPPEKLDGNGIAYDYVRNSIAVAYAKAGNVQKTLEYANMIYTPVWKGEGWASPAYELQKGGHLTEALELLKKARNNSYKYMTTKKNDEGAGFAVQGFGGYSTSIADILYKQKKYAEALKYIKEAYDSSKTVRAGLNSTYAKILMALGKDQQAFDKINEAVKEGQANEGMKENLKTLYVKVKGSNAGYEEYMVSLNKILAEKIKKEIAKQIINLPAPMFTLKDVDGNTISLADYKGKTVVVDFWATWCGPCKKSFPAMRMAVNKYKDAPNVKFLFIHTWERGDDAPTASAKKYIDDNKYPFKVLMDLKDSISGVNKVVESFKVMGIPTKFVIDKNGNIRFKFTGFDGGNDAAVEEVSAMIELADKS
jgi:peroxiredoxin